MSMPKPASDLVRRALTGHAAIGLLAGALIYLVSLSGALIVLHDRWERWEQPDIAAVDALAPAAAQAALAASLPPVPGKPPAAQVMLRFPTDGLPRAVVTTDGGARLVDRRGRPGVRERAVWIDFVTALHENLHLPALWGLIVVGIAGVVLAAAAVTGIVAHPRIVRDAFVLRLRRDPQLARADWHNRLGVWTLPFALGIALTGAFIGLGSAGFTALADAYHRGDLEAAYAPIFGTMPRPDPAPAALPDIARALAVLHARRPEARPTYLIVHAPQTRGQFVQIIAEHPRRLIYGESYLFDAAGAWLGPAGLADGALGQQIAASTYNLHFGNYGGLAVELAYVAFGIALCAIIATGVSLWLCKRRRRGLASRRLIACWHAVLWGAPLLIVAAYWVGSVLGERADLAMFFWLSLAVLIGVALGRPGALAGAVLRKATTAAIVATGIGHVALHPSAPAAVIAIDLVLIALPVAVVLIERRVR